VRTKSEECHWGQGSKNCVSEKGPVLEKPGMNGTGMPPQGKGGRTKKGDTDQFVRQNQIKKKECGGPKTEKCPKLVGRGVKDSL